MKQAIAVSVVLVALTIVGINQPVAEDPGELDFQAQADQNLQATRGAFQEAVEVVNAWFNDAIAAEEVAQGLQDRALALDALALTPQNDTEALVAFMNAYDEAIASTDAFLDGAATCAATDDRDCEGLLDLAVASDAAISEALAALQALGPVEETPVVDCSHMAANVTSDHPVVEIKTELGCIYAEIYQDLVPTTGGNFLALARDGYYDGSPFHRIINGFMMQGGDYTQGNGRGGEAHPDYANGQGNIPDEFHPDLRHDKAGVLSMANAGPNTGSSQFFITFGPTTWLDGKHPVFGQVIAGMDVVQAVEAQAGSGSGQPTIPVTFLQATVLGEA